MNDRERIKRIFDAMDRLFDDDFYGGVMIQDDDDKDKRQTYGGDGFDVFMDDNYIYVTIELHGVSSKGLKVVAGENEVTVGGSIENKYYENTVSLPDKIIPNSMVKSFKNCILDMKFERDKKDDVSG